MLFHPKSLLFLAFCGATSFILTGCGDSNSGESPSVTAPSPTSPEKDRSLDPNSGKPTEPEISEGSELCELEGPASEGYVKVEAPSDCPKVAPKAS